MSSAPPKKYLDLKTKIELIKYKENHPGENVRDLAKMYKCGRTQVSCILKRKEEYLRQWVSNESGENKVRKRQCENNDLNLAIWKWFCMARESNIPVSGPMLQE